MYKYRLPSQLLLILLIFGCSDEPNQNLSTIALYNIKTGSVTNIKFENKVVEDYKYNFLNYEYYSSGGGVAVGDINNDGLSDIYFVANRGSNKLYLNQGNFNFKDITDEAGVASIEGWSSGVAMVDINDDGWLDIYLSRGGNEDRPEDRQNQLFINSGDLKFSEKSAEYGLNDMGRSTQAAFLDYDRDGDLDVYVLNHSNEFKITSEQASLYHQNPPPYSSDRLYKNLGNNKFVDVSLQSGIQNFGFGLGIGVGDLNSDGWPDIFVANDYTQNDFYYINNQNGGFADLSKVCFGHMSLFAMGCDIADINNDGQLDIYEVEMLPEDYIRSKVNMKAMDEEGFYNMIRNGFHYQYMHNSLHINQGFGYYSEISYLAGVAKTDWSWATLLTDVDNDGFKDILVTNGVLHDYKNRDFVKKANDIANESYGNNLPLDKVHELVSTTPLKNYAFKNKNGYSFSESSAEWGFDYAGYSSGMAYGDFDNDGDFDIVINNINSKSFVYQNMSSEKAHKWIKFLFKGPKGNKNGIGTKVSCTTANNSQYQELYSVRGFQSSSEPSMIFGLGDQKQVEKIKIVWPDGQEELIGETKAGSTIIADYNNSSAPNSQSETPKFLFSEQSVALQIDFLHRENAYNDYQQEILLPHKLSQSGPCLAVGDIDFDGLEDFYVGGATGQAGTLFKQMPGGNFKKLFQSDFDNDSFHEDTDALFFDADGDSDLDLYVVSGSNEKPEGDSYYQDRLYLNDGELGFQRNLSLLPNFSISGSCVTASDYDLDGDLDLFIGGRLKPGKYPFPAESVLLENTGNQFVKVANEKAPWLIDLGMVTSASWLDVDQDGDPDLLVTGEWMPLRLFRNDKGILKEISQEMGLNHTEGWWQCLLVDDYDSDGDMDFFAGNMGLNHKLSPKPGHPVHVFADDFDNNQTVDIVLAKSVSTHFKPIRGKDCTSEQMPFISEKFPTFTEFANADLNDLFGSKLNDALHYEAYSFASSYFENTDSGFVKHELPIEAQFSAIKGFIILDANQDGKKDVFLAGNFAETEIETTRLDGGKGLLLQSAGINTWNVLSVKQTGILAGGNVKDLKLIGLGSEKKPVILIGNNGGPCVAYVLN